MKNESSEKYRQTDLGLVKINNNAITTIASVAAMEVKGVHRIGRGFGKVLYETFMRRGYANGVKIRASENEIRLTVYITVEYGVDITRLADEVQENVKNAVEKMTGLILSGVNVVIEGVHSQQAADKQGGR